METEMIAAKSYDYVMIALYSKEIALHYVSGDELALSYKFQTEEEATKCYQFCVGLVDYLENMPAEEREAAHRNWVQMYLAGDDIELKVY